MPLSTDLAEIHKFWMTLAQHIDGFNFAVPIGDEESEDVQQRKTLSIARHTSCSSAFPFPSSIQIACATEEEIEMHRARTLRSRLFLSRTDGWNTENR